MEEIIFFTEKNEHGKYIARQQETNIIQEAPSIPELRVCIQSLYHQLSKPVLVRLYFIKERYNLTFYTKPEEVLEFFY